jgi:hypothetical protein
MRHDLLVSEEAKVIVTAGDLWAALVDVPPDTPVMLWWNPHLEVTVPESVESVGHRVTAQYVSNLFRLEPLAGSG